MVSRLRCFIGIKTHAALGLVVEAGDFKLFPLAVSMLHSLDSNQAKYPVPMISIACQSRRRKTSMPGRFWSKLLKASAKAAQAIYKSNDLVSRQKGNDPTVIAYADKANEQLQRKYYKMVFKGKQRNIAVTAVARGLACFVWGMSTDHIA